VIVEGGTNFTIQNQLIVKGGVIESRDAKLVSLRVGLPLLQVGNPLVRIVIVFGYQCIPVILVFNPDELEGFTADVIIPEHGRTNQSAIQPGIPDIGTLICSLMDMGYRNHPPLRIVIVAVYFKPPGTGKHTLIGILIKDGIPGELVFKIHHISGQMISDIRVLRTGAHEQDKQKENW
jgi:hypothetical protein